jgi:hypothetical protein
MPEIVTCPDCQRTLRVPDNLLGKKVKCPGCQGMFTAAAGNGASASAGVVRPPELPPSRPQRDDDYDTPRSRRRDDPHIEERPSRRRDDDDDRPPRRRDDYDDDYDRRPRRRDDYDDDYDRQPPVNPREGWRKVALGLHLNVIGGWVWVGGMCLLMLGCGITAIIAMAAGQGAMGAMTPRAFETSARTAAVGGLLMMLVLGIVGLAVFAELVLRVTGFGLCMAVPVRRGSNLKILAIVAFALGGVEALVHLSGSVTHLAWASESYSMAGPFGALVGHPYFFIGGGLFALAAMILFLLFARGAAQAVRDRNLPGQFMSLLITYAVLYFVTSMTMVGMCFAAGASMIGSIGASPRDAYAAGTVWAMVTLVITGLLFAAYIAVEIWLILSLGKLRDAAKRAREPA